MENVMMMKGARKIVETCANLNSNEEVIIVTDFFTHDVALAIASAAYEITSSVNIITMPPRSIDGEEPPQCVVEAMKTVDVFFTPVRKSITHTNATRSALAVGARGIMLTQYFNSMLISGGIDADFVSIKPICEWVAKKWTDGKTVKISTPKGTNLVASIEGRPGNAHTGLAHKPGTMTTVPNIESSVSPVEGTTEGVIVADASIPYFDIGILHEPVRYTIEKGKVVKIEGGAQAREIAMLMASYNDENVYNVAQLSIGLNPKCKLQGIMLEDEGVYRTCHVGIGTSTLLGGTIKTAMHYDALMWYPTIEIDGETIMLDGEIQHPLAKDVMK